MVESEKDEVISDFDKKLTALLGSQGVLEEEPAEPNARQRLGLAYWILGVAAACLFLASVALLLCPPEMEQRAERVFEFAKTVVPPLITLIIGFYFSRESSRRSAGDSSDS